MHAAFLETQNANENSRFGMGTACWIFCLNDFRNFLQLKFNFF